MPTMMPRPMPEMLKPGPPITAPPMASTNMTAAMQRLRFLVKSTWFSTRVRGPTEAIMPYRTMQAPPSTGVGMVSIAPIPLPKKLIRMAMTAAMRSVTGL